MVLIRSTDESEKSAIKWMCETGVNENWMQRMDLLPKNRNNLNHLCMTEDMWHPIRSCNGRTSRITERDNNYTRMGENFPTIRSCTQRTSRFTESSNNHRRMGENFPTIISCNRRISRLTESNTTYTRLGENSPIIRSCSRRRSRHTESNNKRLKENSSTIQATKRSRTTVKEDAFIPTSPNWSGLLDVLLAVMLHKLTNIRDRIRFGTVCTSWQSVYRNNCPTSNLPCQLPVLMIPNDERHTLSFLSPFAGVKGSRRNIYDLETQIPSNSRCIGSTEGWLIIEERNENSSTVCLLKPFLSVNNKIYLPSYSHHHFIPCVFKLVLSVDPSTCSDYVVMAYYSGPKYLAFCRSGDKAWTKLKNCPGGYHDIICYKHQFYTVQSSGNVSIWDFSTPHPVERPFIKAPEYDPTSSKKYLVEASGSFFMIYRENPRHSASDSSTIGCVIFKMDPDQLVWNKVKSLDGQTLFLGGISSMSILVSHFHGYCNPNCIYFGYDLIPNLGWSLAFDTVVFNLEDESFERLFPTKCLHSIIWIEPKV